MPFTPGLPGGYSLPGVTAEADMLLGCLPEPVLLAEPDPVTGSIPGTAGLPTKQEVLALLPKHTIAHFSCHGFSDPADPSRSFLALHDHRTSPLTVASLAGIRLEDVKLAYLSACTTAIAQAGQLREEAIHLATAFQLAGFPQVIGTLWNISDQQAPSIARDFYAQLADGHGSVRTSCAARALHHAVLRARQAFPASPSLWAAYVHAGI
jgi:CHAT domain-containing protein